MVASPARLDAELAQQRERGFDIAQMRNVVRYSGSAVSSDAIRIGSVAFLLPLSVTVPRSGAPP